MKKILNDYIKKSGFTYYQISKVTGISKSKLYGFKTGEVKSLSFIELCKISDVIGLSLDLLKEEIKKER